MEDKIVLEEDSGTAIERAVWEIAHAREEESASEVSGHTQ
jgi:hypothetical protein